jgi:hypothetical protein
MQSSPAAAQGPLQPVLVYEAALPRGSTPVCVSVRPEGTAFDEARRDIRSMRESRPSNPRDEARRRQFLSDHEHRQFDWRLPLPIATGGEAALPPPLDSEQAAELSAAIWPLLSSESVEVGSSELGAIPPPLRVGVSAGCGASLTLTAPALHGDLAFVETSYVCGGLCGNGWLYALRRHGTEWRLIAIAFTWIS